MLLLLAAVGLAALYGVATARRLRHHGWARAVLVGVGVAVCAPLLLLASLIMVPPFGYLVGVVAWIAAIRAFGDGRLVAASAWAAVAYVAIGCARWLM